MDSEAIKYRAVLEGLQFQNIDQLTDLSIDECVDVGRETRVAMQDIIDVNNQLRKQLPTVEKETWEKAAGLGLSLTVQKCRQEALNAELRALATGKGRLG